MEGEGDIARILHGLEAASEGPDFASLAAFLTENIDAFGEFRKLHAHARDSVSPQSRDDPDVVSYRLSVALSDIHATHPTMLLPVLHAYEAQKDRDHLY